MELKYPKNLFLTPNYAFIIDLYLEILKNIGFTIIKISKSTISMIKFIPKVIKMGFGP